MENLTENENPDKKEILLVFDCISKVLGDTIPTQTLLNILQGTTMVVVESANINRSTGEPDKERMAGMLNEIIEYFLRIQRIIFNDIIDEADARALNTGEGSIH